MRIRISLALFMVLVIAYVLAPQVAHADNVVYYTVYYSCHVGPGGCNANGDWYGCLVGEWTLNCTGQWTGWGMEPYTSCAEFVDERIGRSCGPDVQGLSSTSSGIVSAPVCHRTFPLEAAGFLPVPPLRELNL